MVRAKVSNSKVKSEKKCNPNTNIKNCGMRNGLYNPFFGINESDSSDCINALTDGMNELTNDAGTCITA